MLEKMGWKHGEGLGREKQGILAPLVARKTDKRSGVIVQGSEKPKSIPNRQTMDQPGPPPSRVVLLMVSIHLDQTFSLLSIVFRILLEEAKLTQILNLRLLRKQLNMETS